MTKVRLKIVAQCDVTDHSQNGCVTIVTRSMYICNEGLVVIDGSLEKTPIPSAHGTEEGTAGLGSTTLPQEKSNQFLFFKYADQTGSNEGTVYVDIAIVVAALVVDFFAVLSEHIQHTQEMDTRRNIF